MKSFLIIGMGTLGHHLCREFAKLKCETMIVDREESQLTDLLDVATSARIADCAREDALKSLGVANFDACFVCFGHNFEQSLMVTSILSELGAKKIYVMADTDFQEKLLLRNGADQVIFPQRDVAASIALAESNDSIFDCIRMMGEHSIYEIAAHPSWIGKTIGQARVRNLYNLNILAIKRGGDLQAVPPVDYVFNKEDHLLVLGTEKDIHKLAGK